MKPIKQKTCKECKGKFNPRTSLQVACSLDCAKLIGQKKTVKDAKVAQKAQSRELAAQKKSLLTCSDWEKKVDKVYNQYTRLRDELAGLPCPSCGRYDHEIPNTYFGKWDCGHYLSKGSHPELRYEELNTWRQCKSCNGGAGNYVRKNYEVQKNYRLTLIQWIGLDKVEWLESKHEPKHYRIPDYIELEKLYKQKLKELKNATV